MKSEVLRQRLFNTPTPTIVSTDSHEFNKLLGGGLRTGNLYIFQGGTGSGKTTVLQRLCIDVLESGHKAMFISVNEQSNIEILERFLCMDQGIDYEQFTKTYDEKDKSKCMKSFNELFSNNLYINSGEDPFYDSEYVFDEFGEQTGAIKKIDAILEECKKNHIQYIFLDYLGACLSLTDANKGLWQYLGECASKLKNEASEYNLCICTAMQLNREGNQLLKEKKYDDIDMQHMAYSSMPAIKSSFCITLYKISDGLYGMNIWKNRLNGKLGKIKISISPLRFKWTDQINAEALKRNDKIF